MSMRSEGAGTTRSAARDGWSRQLRAGLDSYLGILLVGSGVRVFGLASQFIVLIIMGRMLAKSDFGDLMTAFGFYRLVAVAIGTGASLVVLFHVARRPRDQIQEVRLHRFSAVLAAAMSAVVSLAAALFAHTIADALGKPGLALWLQQLAPFALFNALLIVFTGALEGRSRITESIVVGEVAPNAVRMVLLPLVALAGLPDLYIAHVLTLSVVLPWLFALPRIGDRAIGGLQAWTRWDYGYAGKFMIATLFANQLAAVDILVASVLFSSETVGEYAIAARTAGLFAFFQIVMLKRFAPRAGELIHHGDMAGLRAEVESCRRLAIGCTALTICGALAIAPFLFPLFGNYAGALVFLSWLAIPSFVQSFYATSDRLLIIAGQSSVALILTASSFAVLTTSPFLTAQWLGPIAIPVAMIASVLMFNVIVLIRARQLFDVHTLTLRDMALMVLGVAALMASAIDHSALSRAGACLLLAAIGFGMGWTAMRQSWTAPRPAVEAR
ncbi:MAG: hypothetical protein JO000_04455 [Alphaproteobacteria bacterium]|nr:hypothetical protein [Alphaproteobacteria bacterium]